MGKALSPLRVSHALCVALVPNKKVIIFMQTSLGFHCLSTQGKNTFDLTGSVIWSNRFTKQKSLPLNACGLRVIDGNFMKIQFRLPLKRRLQCRKP